MTTGRGTAPAFCRNCNRECVPLRRDYFLGRVNEYTGGQQGQPSHDRTTSYAGPDGTIGSWIVTTGVMRPPPEAGLVSPHRCDVTTPNGPLPRSRQRFQIQKALIECHRMVAIQSNHAGAGLATSNHL